MTFAGFLIHGISGGEDVVVAEEAGAAIMGIYNGKFDIGLKNDASLITIADLTADRIIREQLAVLFPSIPVMSEESPQNLGESTIPKLFFLVDPLEGTKEFIKRSGEFTVNIALIHEQRSTAGGVYAPAFEQSIFLAMSQEHGNVLY